MKIAIQVKGKERGVSLIIVILVMAFMLTVGIALVTITSTGPAVAGNIRLQDQAFNAAEAGFDAAWTSIRYTTGRRDQRFPRSTGRPTTASRGSMTPMCSARTTRIIFAG